MNETEVTEEAADAEALDRMIFADAALTVPRAWCLRPTVRLARLSAEAVARAVGARGAARVVDYGSGTGLAPKALFDALARRGVSPTDIRRRVELIPVDLPGPWFRAADRIEPWWGPVETVALGHGDGRIPGLDAVLGAGGADVVMANMVLHLIPSKALPVALDGIRRTLRPGGSFVWTSPDSGPAPAGALLFHDVNREIRRLFVKLRGRADVEQHMDALPPLRRARLIAAVAAAAEPTELSSREARQQIPDPPSEVEAIARVLDRCFLSRTWRLTAPIDDEDLLRAATVPSNLKNLNEAGAHESRAQLVRLLFAAARPMAAVHPRPAARTTPLAWSVGIAEPRP